MPSMRAMWSAGPAAEFDNITMYNCSFLSVNCVEAFAETLYILMCGTGLGFSIEQKEIENLPEIPKIQNDIKIVKLIEDSREGWADSVKQLMY